MDLLSILRAYRPAYEAQYGASTTPDQWSALNAMLGCRTGQYGAVSVACDDCGWQGRRLASCGHRSCSQCHHHSNALWCERQCQKLLPVTYFMVTFTLPSELHDVARRNSPLVYGLLFDAAIQTLRSFGCNDTRLQAELAATAVLHTHSRRLDYHPHVHLVVPGGVLFKDQKATGSGAFASKKVQWREIKNDYLFNHFNLANVFRGIFLKKLQQAKCSIPKTPQKWVAHCKDIAQGGKALQYLSRYLYRGLLSDKQLVSDDGTEVVFWYKDSQSKKRKQRTVKGETLIRLLLIHVLPKGFRRTRDYGFLHGNAKKKISLLQYALKMVIPPRKEREKARSICPCCQGIAHIVAFITPKVLRKIASG